MHLEIPNGRLGVHLVTCDWNYGFHGSQLHPLHLFGKEASAMLGHLEVDLFMGWRKCAARKRGERGCKVVQGQKKGEGGARVDEKDGAHFNPPLLCKEWNKNAKKRKRR